MRDGAGITERHKYPTIISQEFGRMPLWCRHYEQFRVDEPFARISAEMVHLLPQVIDGQSAAAITLPTELITRASA